MSLQDRIKEAMNGSGLTPAEFSRAAKVSPSAIKQLTDGKTKSLRADTAAQIEIATGYRAAWLALGKGQKKINPGAPHTASEISLELAVECLSRFLESIPLADRDTSSAALAALARHPDTHLQKSALLRLLISGPSLIEERPTGT